MLEQIRNQQEYIDAINDDREALTEQKSLVNKLYQMEIDRLRYMVSSYLRTRLRKVSCSRNCQLIVQDDRSVNCPHVYIVWCWCLFVIHCGRDAAD